MERERGEGVYIGREENVRACETYGNISRASPDSIMVWIVSSRKRGTGRQKRATTVRLSCPSVHDRDLSGDGEVIAVAAREIHDAQHSLVKTLSSTVQDVIVYKRSFPDREGA